MQIDLTKKMIKRSGKEASSTWTESETFLDENNVEFTEEVKKDRPMTLGVLMENACLATINSDKTIEATVNNYRLFNLIANKDEVELEGEDLNNIKQMLCTAYDTFFAGQALALIG